MRMKEIREMSKEELEKRLDEIRLDIAKEIAQSKIGGAPENPGRIREMRRTVARILTELRKRR